ncbi:hypothetical protein MSAN_00911300 [Mycena sanguinolenta]|uniref:Uncharacterized protein n=1 Tax=Mycena sanguinolenta TaxID=230812 RepID=A0A8H6YSU7_9AGAR|nr:hypothetical protein MSAN_00911300 [Mycena sanguinolenta]
MALPASLSLSDIMHTMSPPRERGPSSPVVETLQAQDIAQMRSRALQMGIGTGGETQSTPRERELFEMVLRLTDPNLSSLDPSQLLRQADTISNLVQQRDYLSRCVEEERSRWQSDREGWDRMSEALLTRRNRQLNGPDESGRINGLEAELYKLKPHLLMQPFVPRPVPLAPRPLPPSSPTPAATAIPAPAEQGTQIAPENTSLPASTEPQTISASPEVIATTVEVQVSQPLPPTLQPPSLHALAQASSRKKMTSQLRKTLHASATASSTVQSDASAPGFPKPPSGARTVLSASPSPRKPGRTSKSRRVPPQLSVSDARAEHLLIAARRLGRERAGIVAGVISAERERMEREKADQEKERIEREKERIEREKRNRDGGGYYRERPPQVWQGPAVFQTKRNEGKDKDGSGTQYANAMTGSASVAATPAKTDAKGKGKNPQAPPTPLDSLLDAARSMQDDHGAQTPNASTSTASGTGMTTRGRGRAANANAKFVNETPEAPPPKRRRLSSNVSNPSNRVRTALDVLADQAAVFGGSDVPGNTGKGKGKEKEKEKGVVDESADNAVLPIKRKRGRPPKDRSKTAQAATPTSRLISPSAAAGPSDAAADTPNTSVSASETRPATRRVQRRRLAASTSSKAPLRQQDDLESEDDDAQNDEPVQTEQVAESEPQSLPVEVPPMNDEPAQTEKDGEPEPEPQPLRVEDQLMNDEPVQTEKVAEPEPEPQPLPVEDQPMNDEPVQTEKVAEPEPEPQPLPVEDQLMNDEPVQTEEVAESEPAPEPQPLPVEDQLTNEEPVRTEEVAEPEPGPQPHPVEDQLMNDELAQTEKTPEPEPEPQRHPVEDQPMPIETVTDTGPPIEPPQEDVRDGGPVIRPTAVVIPRPASNELVSPNADPQSVAEAVSTSPDSRPTADEEVPRPVGCR